MYKKQLQLVTHINFNNSKKKKKKKKINKLQ